MMTRGFAALRIFTGLVWLTNAGAKVLDKGLYDFGFISFNLVTVGAARGIATAAIAANPLSDHERDQVARARAGDETGWFAHHEDGTWARLLMASFTARWLEIGRKQYHALLDDTHGQVDAHVAERQRVLILRLVALA